jgi:hypothetical protein
MGRARTNDVAKKEREKRLAMYERRASARKDLLTGRKARKDSNLLF